MNLSTFSSLWSAFSSLSTCSLSNIILRQYMIRYKIGPLRIGGGAQPGLCHGRSEPQPRYWSLHSFYIYIYILPLTLCTTVRTIECMKHLFKIIPITTIIDQLFNLI